MTMPQAIKSCFGKYVTFSGRSSRSEYWYFTLFYVLASIIGNILDAAIEVPVFAAIVTVAFILPSLAAGARRLHDTGRSGWWLLLSFVPLIGVIVLIIWLATKSHQGANKYGPPPPRNTNGVIPVPA
jgi:uncharacterized membrane protein YhaH (DUF805 family)